MDIYVGKLPDSTSVIELKIFFKGFDKQASFEVKRMKGKLGRLTYGLVSIPSDRLAKKAIKKLHMKKFMGKLVAVREFSYRVSNNDRRELGWRSKMWLGEERRKLDRRDSISEKKRAFQGYAV